MENFSEGESPVLSLIRKIQSGAVDPKLLPKEQRTSCVEVLFYEGYSVPEIAEILQKSEKTIRRDLDDVREKNAVKPDMKLAYQFIGEMVQIARSRQGRLERLSKSKDAAVSEKIQAEYLSWRVCKELIEKLQSLGYLPSRPEQIVGEIVHHGASSPESFSPMSFEEIARVITEIKTAAEKAGVFDPEIVKGVEELNADLERARLTYKTVTILEEQKKKAGQNGEDKK